jgi:protein-tyrosine phosphatase
LIDLHCHILPGLDDGPETVEAALEMVHIAVQDGIETIVATPHLLNGIFNVTVEDIYRGVDNLRQEVQKHHLPITLLPGADVYVDKDIPELIGKGKVVTLAGKGKHIMVELPQDSVPQEIADLLFRIQLKGVTPIITHPERNADIQQSPGLLTQLIQAGNLTQVTAGSLTGAFGSRIQECAYQLLKSGKIHLVATDAHSADKRPPRLTEARRCVEQEMGEEEARIMFDERPLMLLKGMYVEPPEPIQKQKTTRQRFWQRFVRPKGRD